HWAPALDFRREQARGAAMAEFVVTGSSHYGVNYAFYNDNDFWLMSTEISSANGYGSFSSYTDINATIGDPGQVTKAVLCPYGYNSYADIPLVVHTQLRTPSCPTRNCRRDALVMSSHHLTPGTWPTGTLDAWS